MPSRKQRRRREKLQRHEYEYVIETEEGEEVPVERPGSHEKKPEGKDQKQTGRRGRAIQPPSMQRVLRRAAIFGPILVILVFVTSPSLSTAAKILNALILLAFFLPFSYLVDVIVYRAFQRRQAKHGGGRT